MAIVSVNPATEEQLASFDEHTWEQVDAALQHAYDTRYAWRDAGFDARAARFTLLLEAIPADQRQTVIDALTLLVEASHDHADRPHR